MTPPFEIYLASTSPRRRQLLQQIGVRFQQLSIDVREAVAPSESPADYVRRAALDKACAGWDGTGRRRELPVLGADTEVVLDGQVLGKPRDPAHGLELLRRLSGRSHQVLSAVAVVRGARREVRLSVSTVQFRELTDADCRRYWATGEPADKAGAYAIQGRGAIFVRHLEGSYSGVMGLPLYETAVLLGRFGVDVVK